MEEWIRVANGVWEQLRVSEAFRIHSRKDVLGEDKRARLTAFPLIIAKTPLDAGSKITSAAAPGGPDGGVVSLMVPPSDLSGPTASSPRAWSAWKQLTPDLAPPLSTQAARAVNLYPDFV